MIKIGILIILHQTSMETELLRMELFQIHRAKVLTFLAFEASGFLEDWGKWRL